MIKCRKSHCLHVDFNDKIGCTFHSGGVFPACLRIGSSSMNFFWAKSLTAKGRRPKMVEANKADSETPFDSQQWHVVVRQCGSRSKGNSNHISWLKSSQTRVLLKFVMQVRKSNPRQRKGNPEMDLNWNESQVMRVRASRTRTTVIAGMRKIGVSSGPGSCGRQLYVRNPDLLSPFCRWDLEEEGSNSL